jgi:hypothetical protein
MFSVVSDQLSVGEADVFAVIVVFRSAIERPFAERKATLFDLFSVPLCLRGQLTRLSRQSLQLSD